MGNEINTNINYDEYKDEFLLKLNNEEDYIKFKLSDSLIEKVYNLKIKNKKSYPKENGKLNNFNKNNNNKSTLELEKKIINRVKNIEIRLNNITESYINHSNNLSIKSNKENIESLEKDNEKQNKKSNKNISNLSGDKKNKTNEKENNFFFKTKYSNKKINRSVSSKININNINNSK